MRGHHLAPGDPPHRFLAAVEALLKQSDDPLS